MKTSGLNHSLTLKWNYMKATFENSIQVLVMGLASGQLEATSCAACVCGLLVADANNYTLTTSSELWKDDLGARIMPAWSDVTWGYRLRPGAENQVLSTGYSADEFRKIENAFMENIEEDAPKKEAYAQALLHVADVLGEIHGVDNETIAAAKELFKTR